jgi:hypothetical protein
MPGLTCIQKQPYTTVSWHGFSRNGYYRMGTLRKHNKVGLWFFWFILSGLIVGFVSILVYPLFRQGGF